MRRPLLAEADFRRLWAVGLVLFAVRWMEMLAFGVFAYEASNSAFVVAMLTMLRLLPMGLLGAVFGAVAERLERRTVLISSIALMMVGSLVMAVLATLGMLQVWHLAVASFINGLGWATDHPVRRVMIGDMLGADRMGRAMSLDVGSNNANRMLGPLLGGVVLASFGIAGVFWLGLALYAVGLVTALRIQFRSRIPGLGAEPFLTALRDGLTWLRGNRPFVGILLITVIFNVFGWPLLSMIPVIGRDNLHLGPEGVGLLGSLEGIGQFIGVVAVSALVRAVPYRRVYVGGVAGFLSMLISFALAPSPNLAGLFLLLSGISGAGFSVMQATLAFLHAPVGMRSRMLGLVSVCIGMGPIGFLYLGLLAEWLGAPAAIIAIGLQGLLAIVLTRRFWRLIGQDAPPATADVETPR